MLTPDTRVLLKVHPSNYRIVGFTGAVSTDALAALGREHGPVVVEDLGSGSLIDLKRFGLPTSRRCQRRRHRHAARRRHAPPAKGQWVEGALASMLQSSETAAAVLQRHGAYASTDVTGFGLLGHLVEMVRPSEVDARLDLASIPILDGALETARRGILSSLQPANALRPNGQANHDVWPLLFHPQTAGGLLAAVLEASAAGCAAELRSLGY